eukprot:3838471-Ditylum_brightwellii.AAC.1
MIIDVCITDTDAQSYTSKLLQSVLAAQEKGKKGKYLQVMCTFFINEHMLMTMQGQGRHWPPPNLY